jgi:hypothetical protein
MLKERYQKSALAKQDSSGTIAVNHALRLTTASLTAAALMSLQHAPLPLLST